MRQFYKIPSGIVRIFLQNSIYHIRYLACLCPPLTNGCCYDSSFGKLPTENSVSNKLIIDFSFLVKTYYFDLFVALDKIQFL